MTIMIPAWVNGALTPIEKLEAHQRGLRHKAVSVFVMRGDMLLLQQRALGKYHTPGLWANACCTHPGWDESSETTAVRRLEEELGIVGQLPKFRQRAEYRADVGNGLVEHEVVDIFVVDANAQMSVSPNPDEVMAVRWVRFSDLLKDVVETPDIYTPWLRIYLEKHATAIFGDALVTSD
ncbi:isopentenyl-diphosphate Delta-isomerase [Roseobacteraceae bacterium S113]